MEFYLHLDLEKKTYKSVLPCLKFLFVIFSPILCPLVPLTGIKKKKKKGERREKEWTFWYSIETLGSAQFLKENQIITPRPSLRGLTLREKRHS